MKTYKESTLSYKCTGCGASIYNASKEFKVCPNCGYDVIEINKKVDNLKNESRFRRS